MIKCEDYLLLEMEKIEIPLVLPAPSPLLFLSFAARAAQPQITSSESSLRAEETHFAVTTSYPRPTFWPTKTQRLDSTVRSAEGIIFTNDPATVRFGPIHRWFFLIHNLLIKTNFTYLNHIYIFHYFCSRKLFSTWKYKLIYIK